VFFTAAVSKTRVKEHDGVISGFPFLAKPASVEEVIEQIELGLGKVSPLAHAPSAHNRVTPFWKAALSNSGISLLRTLSVNQRR
jgi:hypothetical protein